MTITLNGSNYVTKAMTVADLLSELGIKLDMVAIEHNRRIVKKTEMDSVGISEGDVIEIVNFVGGG